MKRWVDFIKKLFSKIWKKKKPAPPAEAADAIKPSKIKRWLGPNFAGARKNATLRSAEMNQAMIYTDYQTYHWPSLLDARTGKYIDAICCLFYEKNGEIVGGKFDHWAAGGQRAKVLHNVVNGYGGHSFPGKNARCWTMIASQDGSLRSNIIEVKRR